MIFRMAKINMLTDKMHFSVSEITFNFGQDNFLSIQPVEYMAEVAIGNIYFAENYTLLKRTAVITGQIYCGDITKAQMMYLTVFVIFLGAMFVAQFNNICLCITTNFPSF